jgi:hypothetical protein
MSALNKVIYHTVYGIKKCTYTYTFNVIKHVGVRAFPPVDVYAALWYWKIHTLDGFLGLQKKSMPKLWTRSSMTITMKTTMMMMTTCNNRQLSLYTIHQHQYCLRLPQMNLLLGCF